MTVSGWVLDEDGLGDCHEIIAGWNDSIMTRILIE